MNESSRQRLFEILALDTTQLTDEHVAFLRARAAYIPSEHKARLSDILADVEVVEDLSGEVVSESLTEVTSAEPVQTAQAPEEQTAEQMPSVEQQAENTNNQEEVTTQQAAAQTTAESTPSVEKNDEDEFGDTGNFDPDRA